jgi:histidinol-phosphatase
MPRYEGLAYNSTMSQILQTYFDFITETAYLAGRSTLAHFQTGVQADYKADRSPVTLADKASEELIRRRIESRFPGHAILGEEFGGVVDETATHRWFIDPIDGTKSFLRGVPLYAVLIGLEIEGRVEVGAAYFPALDEMLAAATGLGCWWNGRRARVSSVPRLEEAWVTFTDPGSFDKYGRAGQFERLKKAAYHRAGWSDAYGYLLVATGRAEVMLDPIMAVWDCAPFPPIFREAGGYFGDWQGQETIDHMEALATTQALLAEVLETLAPLPNNND